MGQQQEGWPFCSQPTDLCHFLLKGQLIAAGIYCHLLQEPTLPGGHQTPCHNPGSFFQQVVQQKVYMTEEERRDSEIHPPSSTSHPSLLNSNCARVQCWSPRPASLLQALPSAPPQVWALLNVACAQADFSPIHRAQQRGIEGTEETSSLSSSLFQVLGHWTFWEFNINVLVSVPAKKLSATIGKK